MSPDFDSRVADIEGFESPRVTSETGYSVLHGFWKPYRFGESDPRLRPVIPA